MKVRMSALFVLVLCLTMMGAPAGAMGKSTSSGPLHGAPVPRLAPKCWKEAISFTGERPTGQTETIHRVSTYEIHDDDSVNPNHSLTDLPYYTSPTWQGSQTWNGW